MKRSSDLTPCLITGKNPDKRETVLIEHLWKKKEIPASEGVRTDRWKYFRYKYINAPEELYDLPADPPETNNLAQDESYSQILEKLQKQCDDLSDDYAKAGMHK